MPGYIEDELRGYLECGLLCFGFARGRCTGCGQAFVVAFSCKGRGVCPSCNGRHMAQTAAHLVDHVIPPPISPARGPPIDWAELAQVHDDRDIFQTSPHDLPAIDIHGL